MTCVPLHKHLLRGVAPSSSGCGISFRRAIPCCVTFAESEPCCHSILFVCLSGCLSVIPRPTAYHDWSITTKFGRQVYTCPRTRVSLFGSPISHTFRARGKNMHNFAYFQRQPFNAYSCHCERDASCHITCLFYSGCMSEWLQAILVHTHWTCSVTERRQVASALDDMTS